MNLERCRELLRERITIPNENAVYNLTTSQWAAICLLLGFAVRLVLDFGGGLLPWCALPAVYLAVCLHKVFLIVAGAMRGGEMTVSEIDMMSRREWPVYTILLPVYREREIFPQLFRAVGRISYPPERLDVILLLEEDDAETAAAAAEAGLPPWWRVMTIPDMHPKTKGKALDFGLRAARGELLVIYDAEDIPESDQLKKAAVAFSSVDGRTVCLQAKLNYYNPYQNMLTRWFTAEYSTWFDLYLPGLDRAGAPIPLGGTSNHFRTAVLRELGGWDPFNVTEDCDLGVRIARAGYRTRVLDTTTWEEANSRLDNWIKQRSRWVKGYIQTYFVHMRSPWALLHSLGPGRFLHFNLTVGGNFFVLVANPVAWVLLAHWIVAGRSSPLPNAFFAAATPVLLAGNLFFVFVNVLGCLRRRYHRIVVASLLSPVYWVLMSVGAWKGLLQYFHKPHFWEKTDHALFEGVQKLP